MTEDENNKKLLDYFKGDELAANVWKSKYAQEGDITPNDMHKRMAKEFARIEYKYQSSIRENKKIRNYDSISDYGKERDYLTEDRIYNLFKDFKHIIPQGSIMSTLGTDKVASLSNCWVAESPVDSYAGIHKTDGDLIYYYKRRGGVGTDISNLRPANTSTNNTALTTTGAVSFMERFSNTTREVAMNGRRGALMLSMDINHPDILDFIKIKRDLTKVTGANISIRMRDDFMKAVESDSDYILKFPCEAETFSVEGKMEYDKLYETTSGDVKYIKKIKAKEYWNEIITSAKDFAEPGLMYWDNVNNYDPTSVYPQFKATCSNPCGEQFLNPNDSCRLMALNLYSFVDEPFTDDAMIDYQKLYEVSYEFTRLGDDLVDLELEYIQRIIDKIKSDPEDELIKRQELELWQKSYNNTKAGRRIGLGITGLGDMLAALGLEYDSEDGLEVTELVMKAKMEAELDCNIDLAILRGTFEGWDTKKEIFNDGLGNYSGQNNFYEFVCNEFPEQADRMTKHGRRSVSWSTIAPTGSVSILTQTTSGCEPMFSPYYFRKKKVNPGEDVRVDFVDQNGDSWQEFPVLHQKFKDWYIIETRCEHVPHIALEALGRATKDDLQKIFENSPWYNSTANDIDWIKRVEIQSILQKYTTNAISSTINLPSTVSHEEVSDIYMEGWKQGLKGQTVYVDGSRSGVLTTESVGDTSDKFEYKSAPKRPDCLDCDIHTTVSKGFKWNVIVGLLDGKPYEMFAIPYFTNETSMVLCKKSKGRYDLEKDGITYSENITSEMSPEEEIITRLISTSLRHGTDNQFIVSQLRKTTGDITSFGKATARILAKYIKDGEIKTSEKCSNCESPNLIYQEGCQSCQECGSSKCG